MISRIRALWNRHAAGLQRAKLDKPPLDLLMDATGLELAQLLAMGFACSHRVLSAVWSGGWDAVEIRWAWLAVACSLNPPRVPASAT